MFCVFPTGANLFINMLDCLDLAKHKQAGFVLFFCCCFLFKGIKKNRGRPHGGRKFENIKKKSFQTLICTLFYTFISSASHVT